MKAEAEGEEVAEAEVTEADVTGNLMV